MTERIVDTSFSDKKFSENIGNMKKHGKLPIEKSIPDPKNKSYKTYKVR